MNSNIKKKLKSEGFRKKEINSLAQQTICLRTLNKLPDEEVSTFLLKEVSVIVA